MTDSVVAQASNDRREAMQAVLWNSDAGTWYDYDLVRQEHRRYNTISNYIPMWAGVLDKVSESSTFAHVLRLPFSRTFPGRNPSLAGVGGAA